MENVVFPLNTRRHSFHPRTTVHVHSWGEQNPIGGGIDIALVVFMIVANMQEGQVQARSFIPKPHREQLHTRNPLYTCSVQSWPFYVDFMNKGNWSRLFAVFLMGKLIFSENFWRFRFLWGNRKAFWRRLKDFREYKGKDSTKSLSQNLWTIFRYENIHNPAKNN